MSIIEWDSTFSVGHDEIDDQHRRWIQIINNLDDALRGGDPEKQSKIKTDTLDAMIDYARYHFEFEEQFMEEIYYPEIETHKKRHRQLLDTTVQIQSDITNGFTPLNTQLMSIMMNWLKDHILSEDKKLGRFKSSSKGLII